MRQLAIDLYCGLGGWAEGFLAEGFRVIGFYIERHDYGTGGYPGWLVLQDVTTLHGSQFSDAAVIIASPPCQEYSYMAMPWKKAKAKEAAIRADHTGAALEKLNRLFDACFRIQREACEAAGRHIPLIVENVRGAQKWVGRAKWHFGSYYLWGDLPALMPVAMTLKLKTVGPSSPVQSEKYNCHINEMRDGLKVGAGVPLSKVGFNVACVRKLAHGDPNISMAEGRLRGDGIKVAEKEFDGYGGNFGWDKSQMRQGSSKSNARKAASAAIAKIPFPLAQHIARCFKSVHP